MAQADAVARMAARASSPAEQAVYESIAQGWRKLASEARRNERGERGAKGGSSERPTAVKSGENDGAKDRR